MNNRYPISNPSDINPPGLDSSIRLLVYKCDSCMDINIIPGTSQKWDEEAICVIVISLTESLLAILELCIVKIARFEIPYLGYLDL